MPRPHLTGEGGLCMMKLRRLKKLAKMRSKLQQNSVAAKLYNPSSRSENHFLALLWPSAGSQRCTRRYSMTDA